MARRAWPAIVIFINGSSANGPAIQACCSLAMVASLLQVERLVRPSRQPRKSHADACLTRAPLARRVEQLPPLGVEDAIHAEPLVLAVVL
eukprot:3531187-Alexandrium_andersonii.AAC.1